MKTKKLEELKEKLGADLTLEICQRLLPEASVDLEGLSLDDMLAIYKKADGGDQQEGLIKIIKEFLGVEIITSPIVGTFCASGKLPSNTGEPLVKIGDQVEPDTILCATEIMMVDNPVKAGVSGTIIKILAKDGDAIEYGQALFVIKPESKPAPNRPCPWCD